MGDQNSSVLAQLPPPLLETDGQTQFGPCYGLRGSRKRKRFEIAAAVDGETLNIYDVQSSRLVSSYAVPPTFSFTCPPCSIRRQHSSGSVTTRYTICCELQRTGCQVVCFKETIEHPETPVISTYRYVIEDQSPAVHIDFVPVVTDSSEAESLPDIIVVHHDGTVRRISGNLQKTRWVAASVPKSDERALPPAVVSAHWVSYEDASIALLRRRDDILKECAASESSFLVLLYRDGDHQESGLRIGMFDVPTTERAGLNSATPGQQLRLLVSNPMPDSRRWNLAANIQVDFHAPSARLSISSRNELINYDLSCYAPEVSSKLVLDEGHSSLFPLTGSLAVGALRSAVQIYDTSYQSITARFNLSTKLRRRGKEDTARKTVRFVAYFAKIDILVAVRGRNLLSFNLPRKRVKKIDSAKEGSFLIESLGRSTYASARITNQAQAELGPGFIKALFVPNQLEKAGWEARQKGLNELVLRHNVEEFEHAMANEFQDAAAEEVGSTRQLPPKLPSDEQFVRADKIHYLLSKIFRASAHSVAIGEMNEGLDVAIAFFPLRLLQWLARHNHLRTSEIERAFSDEHSQPQLRLGAVANAMMAQDPSLGLLADYLHGANLSGLDEAVTVIKLLVKEAVTMAKKGSPSEQLLLEDSNKMALDEPITYESEISASESQPAVDAGGWPRECVTAMKCTLETFDGFSPLKVTSAIRTHLDTEEVLALIQFLRQQLFRSGYTSSFPSLSVASGDAVLSLEITVLVLSSCIDALGPSGFLGSTFDQGLWQDLVPDLKTEISLALAGIEEATYLKGVLQEMVRYAYAAASTQVLPIDSPLHGSETPDKESGTIIRVYAEPAEAHGHGIQERSSLLPLSLDVENAVSKTKKRKGGGEVIERTGRELQYMKTRNVGRYSFERLIL